MKKESKREDKVSSHGSTEASLGPESGIGGITERGDTGKADDIGERDITSIEGTAGFSDEGEPSGDGQGTHLEGDKGKNEGNTGIPGPLLFSKKECLKAEELEEMTIDQIVEYAKGNGYFHKKGDLKADLIKMVSYCIPEDLGVLLGLLRDLRRARAFILPNMDQFPAEVKANLLSADSWISEIFSFYEIGDDVLHEYCTKPSREGFNELLYNHNLYSFGEKIDNAIRNITDIRDDFFSFSEDISPYCKDSRIHYCSLNVWSSLTEALFSLRGRQKEINRTYS